MSAHELPPIMAIRLYCDESETTGKVFTLAGFMAAPSGWDKCVPKWREMLCTTGPYPVDAYHAADIEAARPPFDGWPKQDRDRLVESAVDLLRDTGLCANLYAVGCTFVLEDFKALNPQFLRSVADNYEYCYRVLFYMILNRWVFNGYDFVFDDKEKVKGRVEKHYREAKARLDANPEYAGKLSDIMWRDDRKVIPLQAADLLAYEIRRHTWARVTRGHASIRSAYQRIKETFAVRQETAPPYRERAFRCYDGRFLTALSVELKKAPNLTPDQLIDLWYHLDAPED